MFASRWLPALLAFVAGQALAQEFEVAAVKLVEGTPAHTVSLLLNHENVTLHAATVRQMVGFAYNIQRVRVLDGPPWTDDTEYDVTAKAPSPNVTRDEARVMLQKLLAQHFKLEIARSVKEVDQYTLALGKNGPRLKAADPDEPTEMTPKPSRDGGWSVVFKNRDLVGLVNTIAKFTNSPVRDETGLKGKYDFEISFRTVWEDPSANGESGPTLFQAVERLGLKLSKGKGPQEVITIVKAEQPSEN